MILFLCLFSKFIDSNFTRPRHKWYFMPSNNLWIIVKNITIFLIFSNDQTVFSKSCIFCNESRKAARPCHIFDNPHVHFALIFTEKVTNQIRQFQSSGLVHFCYWTFPSWPYINSPTITLFFTYFLFFPFLFYWCLT